MEPYTFYDPGLSKRKILDSLLVVDLPRQKGIVAFYRKANPVKKILG